MPEHHLRPYVDRPQHRGAQSSSRFALTAPETGARPCPRHIPALTDSGIGRTPNPDSSIAVQDTEACCNVADRRIRRSRRARSCCRRPTDDVRIRKPVVLLHPTIHGHLDSSLIRRSIHLRSIHFSNCYCDCTKKLEHFTIYKNGLNFWSSLNKSWS